MTTQASTEILVLRPDVVVTTLEREAVLLDLETKYFYSVNHPGWAITQLFESGATRIEARDRAVAWGAGNGDLGPITEFIERLVTERLVTRAEERLPGEEVRFEGTWSAPTLQKHREPLQRVMVSAFDPTLPLAE